MNRPSNNGDDSSLDEHINRLRDNLPNRVAESRLEQRMRDRWESLGSKNQNGERSPNNFKKWLVVSTAAVLLLSTSLLLFEQEKHVNGGSQNNKLKWTSTTVGFNTVFSKETNPCNILPPLPDWRS